MGTNRFRVSILSSILALAMGGFGTGSPTAAVAGNGLGSPAAGQDPASASIRDHQQLRDEFREQELRFRPNPDRRMSTSKRLEPSLGAPIMQDEPPKGDTTLRDTLQDIRTDPLDKLNLRSGRPDYLRK
jgi:hypothetical protein